MFLVFHGSQRTFGKYRGIKGKGEQVPSGMTGNDAVCWAGVRDSADKCPTHLQKAVGKALGSERSVLGSGRHSAIELGCHVGAVPEVPFKQQLTDKSCSPCTLQPGHKASGHTQGWVWSGSRSHPAKMSKHGARALHTGPGHRAPED